MAYTVKKISELSGVSIRTLHYYEEAGLLEPAYYGTNGYRYYQEKQLFELQQILFFKELGFTLKETRKVLGRSDFDQLKALYSHKEALKKNREKMDQLIKTVGKTINHLEGKKKMKEKDIYKGFYDWAEGKGGESFFIGQCKDPDDCENDAEALVLKNVKKGKNKNWTKEDYEKHVQTVHAIFKKLMDCIEKKLDATSVNVQKIVKEHHSYSQKFHTCTKEVYKTLAELYRTHPEYKKQIDPFHPKLAEFLSEAVEVFANSKLG